jgi:hypothetical protein
MAGAAAIAVDLTDVERTVLLNGLNEWGGPARCNEALAVAMGFASAQDLFDRRSDLAASVRAGAMSADDWCRVVLATEIVFASDLVGSGCDWPITTGCSDEDTLAALRRIQRKLPGSVFAAARGGRAS